MSETQNRLCFITISQTVFDLQGILITVTQQIVRKFDLKWFPCVHRPVGNHIRSCGETILANVGNHIRSCGEPYQAMWGIILDHVGNHIRSCGEPYQVMWGTILGHVGNHIRSRGVLYQVIWGTILGHVGNHIGSRDAGILPVTSFIRYIRSSFLDLVDYNGRR